MGLGCFAQIQTPQPSTFSNYQPATGSNYQVPSTHQYQNPMPHVPMGATANDIMRQTNRNSPYYRAPGDSRTTQQMTQAWIKEQMRNDPAYNPTLRSPLNRQGKYNSRLNDLQEIINEARTLNNRKPLAQDYSSSEFATQTKTYSDALQSLKNMLDSKNNLSVAQAFFIIEHAYGGPYLTQNEFDNILKQSVAFIQTWMQQNGLDINDNIAVYYAIQKFMSEKLHISKEKGAKDNRQELQIIEHDKFHYDYNDFAAEKDHRNFFLTKCLATGTGQCSSLPALYIVLAEALNVKAYLSLAPQHFLVKYPDNDRYLRNYEPTSNWDITDKWYLDNMFISREAVQNEIYLQAWNKEQMVADCILQLAFGYLRKFGAADGKFVIDCVKTANEYFPEHNNLTIYFTLSSLYGHMLGRTMQEKGITSLNDIVHYPEAMKYYKAWENNEQYIQQLGYQDNPPQLYDELMKYHEFRGRLQERKGISEKEKRDMFTIINN